MSTTITNPATNETTTPTLMLGIESAREGQNIFHDVLGGGQDVTLRPAALRTGVLRLLYATEAPASAAAAMLAKPAVFRVVDTDVPSASMSFALAGTLALRLHEERSVWLLDVGYREVAA